MLTGPNHGGKTNLKVNIAHGVISSDIAGITLGEEFNYTAGTRVVFHTPTKDEGESRRQMGSGGGSCMYHRYQSREDAGRALADIIARRRLRGSAIVVALPRGGVPVGAEIAARLGAPLDLLSVRKIGAPGRPELACPNKPVCSGATRGSTSSPQVGRKQRRSSSTTGGDYPKPLRSTR